MAQSELGCGMLVRKATLDDLRRVFEWRNDPLTVANFRTGSVEWSDHMPWFPGQLENPKTLCLIGEHEKQPCGVVWFHKNKTDIWETSVNMGKEFRGKGLSVPMLSSAIEVALPGAFSTEIRYGNTPSEKMFLACGFCFIFGSVGFGTYYRSR